ncbi:MAG: hypothetical protein ACOYOL_05145 [Chthoniobacterales bacterium]
MTKFLTASEISRATGEPLSKILRLVADGLLAPAGRAGASANSAMIFAEGDLAEITAALRTNACAKLSSHPCETLADVRAKAQALARAALEGRE